MKYFFALVFVFAVMVPAVCWAVTEAECKSINTNFTSVKGVCVPGKTGLSEVGVKEIVVNVLEWLLGIFGVLGIITFVVAGIFYLTAAGDAEQEKKAKNAMKMGIIGMIVGLAGFVVIQAIDTALNARSGF